MIINRHFKSRVRLLEVQQHPFAVFNCGLEHFDANHPVGIEPKIADQHVHGNVCHLVLYRSGTLPFRIGNRLLSGIPGVLALTNPREPHCFAPLRRSAPAAYYAFSFESAGLGWNELLEYYFGVKFKPPATIQQLADEPAAELGALIEQAEHAFSFGESAICMAVVAIFDFLVRKVMERATAAADPRLERARLKIERDFIGKLPMEELAKLAEMSVGHFQRTFKLAYRVSPGTYQQRLRLNMAKTLLHSDGFSIKEIAYRCGFPEEFYFSRYFKKQVGVTPGTYRRQLP